MMMETGNRNPAGAKPARQRLATSRKRVLRGPGKTQAAKRRQRVRTPCDRASKASGLSGPPPLAVQGQYQGAVKARHQGPAGVQRAGQTHERVPQEPGRSDSLHRAKSSGTAEQRDNQSEAGWSVGSRSCAWYRGSGDSRSRATPWRDGAVVSRTCWRERCQGHRACKASQRNSNG